MALHIQLFDKDDKVDSKTQEYVEMIKGHSRSSATSYLQWQWLYAALNWLTALFSVSDCL